MGVGARIGRGCTSGQAIKRRRPAFGGKLDIHDVRLCRGLFTGLFCQEGMAMSTLLPLLQGTFPPVLEFIPALIIGILFGAALEVSASAMRSSWPGSSIFTICGSSR